MAIACLRDLAAQGRQGAELLGLVGTPQQAAAGAGLVVVLVCGGNIALPTLRWVLQVAGP
jgi:hypothetical protein